MNFECVIVASIFALLAYLSSGIINNLIIKNKNISSKKKLLIRRVESFIILTLIFFSTIFLSDRKYIDIIVWSDTTWIVLISGMLLYYGMILFIYKKKLQLIFALKLFLIPIIGAILLFKDNFHFSDKSFYYLKLYLVIIAFPMGIVKAYSYIDDYFQKKGGPMLKKWNMLIDFFSFEFLIR